MENMNQSIMIIDNERSQSIMNLERQIGQLVIALNSMKEGQFSSYIIKNPKENVWAIQMTSTSATNKPKQKQVMYKPKESTI
ncbi:hypothetical protein Syun_020887 [Stephania yunnanensis]|uniref:Uncharacterized protein n=1 Tax=Stephania yunnanensis TaxID=152371 RepID=A0AAP0IFA3_9MAGN